MKLLTLVLLAASLALALPLPDAGAAPANAVEFATVQDLALRKAEAEYPGARLGIALPYVDESGATVAWSFVFRADGGKMGDYDEVMLENVPESSPLLHALEEEPRRFIIKRAVADACPYLTLDDRTESVLGKIEGKQSLKRKMKKLAAKGDLRFHHYTDPLEMEKAMVSLMETYLERFDPANLKKRLPMEIAFHRELLRRMGPEQMIQFSALELGERPIARHFGFSYDGVYHWVRPAFDPLYAEHSPGAVLLYHLIVHARKNAFREFDFLRGKEAFKTVIAGQMRQVMMVKLYRSLPKYILCKAAAAVNTWLQRLAFRQT